MADKLEWKKEYEVGVSVIDEQHKKLVELAGSLYTAVTGDAEAYARDLPKILKGLGDYTVYHFSTEEALMKKFGYPGAQTHKLAHRNFVAELNNQVKKLARCSIDDGIQFYEFVGLWLITHIAKSDKLLAEFLVKKAESAEELEKAGAEAASSLSK